MLASADDQLQSLARHVAESLPDPDKRQLRFNDIVATAKRFYPHHPESGVVELVLACDKRSNLYTTRKDPMWLTLQTQYEWMVPLWLKPEWRIDNGT